MSAAVPASVSVARARARARGRPAFTPPSASASTRSATKPGPEPDSPVTASSSGSSTSCTLPTAASSLRTLSRVAADTAGVLEITDTPRPTRQGVFGITRTTRGTPVHSPIVAVGSPATIETITDSPPSPGANSRHAAAACCGFTARITSGAAATASRGVSATRMPGTRAASRSSAGAWGS